VPESRYGFRRRKRERALTEVLRLRGEEKVSLSSQKRTEAVADLAWQLATEGKCTFPDGREIKAGAREWKDVTAWLYNQIDGPAVRDDEALDAAASALAGASERRLRDLVAAVAGRLPDSGSVGLAEPDAAEVEEAEEDTDWDGDKV
jgi:hypothetical protein